METFYSEDEDYFYTVCSECGEIIRYETEFYEQEDAYIIDDVVVCEDCISDYMRKNYFLKIKMEE
jgi:RNase P subunit RPR2